MTGKFVEENGVYRHPRSKKVYLKLNRVGTTEPSLTSATGKKKMNLSITLSRCIRRKKAFMNIWKRKDLFLQKDTGVKTVYLV